MSEMEFILYEVVERVAVITLNRPERRNAQNPQLLRELDGAWTMASASVASGATSPSLRSQRCRVRASPVD